MSDGQMSLFLDKKTKERLRAEARLREVNVSMVARNLIVDGLNRLSKPDEVLSTLVMEEMLITLFGLEALLAKVFLDPKASLGADEEIKNQMLDTAESRAREKTRGLLHGGQK